MLPGRLVNGEEKNISELKIEQLKIENCSIFHSQFTIGNSQLAAIAIQDRKLHATSDIANTCIEMRVHLSFANLKSRIENRESRIEQLLIGLFSILYSPFSIRN